MAWTKTVEIKSGYLAGESVGITDFIPEVQQGFGRNSLDTSITRAQQGVDDDFINPDIDAQIDVSSYFLTDAPDFIDEEFASIAIKDNNAITGYISLYATKSTGSPSEVNIHSKFKNASGVVLGQAEGIARIYIQNTNAYTYFDPPKVYLALALGTYNDHTMFSLALNMIQVSHYGGGLYCNSTWAGLIQDMTMLYGQWNIAGHVDGDGKKKSPEFGDASIPDGGYNPKGKFNPSGKHGTFDDSSDIIPVPALPSVGVTSAGFINVYIIQPNQLQNLGEKLFPHFLPAELLDDPSQMNVTEMLAVIVKTFYGTLVSPVGTSIKIADNLGIIDILMNGKLIDYILDCHIIPTAISGATVEGLRVGYRQFNDLQLAKATTDYVEIDCGSLSIAEYWANFLDSSCTTKLFLPFVGFVPIENEYWNDGTIKVIYHFNIIDGSFQAYVVSTSGKSKLTNSVIGQYGGVCCVHMPITGLQYSNVVAGLVNGSAGVVAKGASGDVGGAVTNAMNMAMLRPDAPSSNGYNASSSFLSERFPYLLIERPTAQFSENYNREMGLPLNVTFRLSSVHGYTVIDNPVLNVACNETEYNELVSLLKNGVILP